MDNQNFDGEQTFNVFQYVNENILGLILLGFAFYIIYFVDYINRLNALIYSTPSPVPGLPSATVPTTQKRKSKKH